MRDFLGSYGATFLTSKINKRFFYLIKVDQCERFKILLFAAVDIVREQHKQWCCRDILNRKRVNTNDNLTLNMLRTYLSPTETNFNFGTS